MTNEEIQIKVDELAVKYNSKVIPVVFKTQEETVVCFLKEISRTAKCFLGDELTLLITGTSGDKVKFTGSNWVSAGTATLSSGLKAVIKFVFDGAKWVEASRVVQ